jgi:23S rRNA pseudouridine1911/1915/1917 synthase
VSTPELHVLYEDNHLLAVSKPAGLATIGVATDELSLAKLAKHYLKAKYRKPGNVYLGVMSRLDAAVSGVVLFARTSKAAARLTELFRDHAVEKIYVAVVEGVLEPASAALDDWVAKNDARQRMEIVEPNHPGAQHARLSYRRLAAARESSFAEIQLQTGRKHQIRLQLGSRRHPVVGDRKYGSTRGFRAGIALHSARLTVKHPTRDEVLTFVCPPPPTWRSLGFDGVLKSRS